MRYVRMLGLCLVTVFAVAAIVAASASAKNPEWGECYAKTGGKYADSNCQTKATKGKGAYEWKKGAQVNPVKFSGENVGSGGVLSAPVEQCGGFKRVPRSKCPETPEYYGPYSIECESERSTGEAVGADGVANVSVTFTGCKLLGAVPCESGATEGEVQVNPLKGVLGYINKAKKEVGVLLEPKTKHGVFAEFRCYHLRLKVGVGSAKEGAFYAPEKTGGYDGIISPITPVDAMTTQFTQVYTKTSGEGEYAVENIPSKFEGKHIELLEDSQEAIESGDQTLWSSAGEEITNVNTPEKPGEIKA